MYILQKLNDTANYFQLLTIILMYVFLLYKSISALDKTDI